MHTESRQVGAYRLCVEILHPDTEVIHVAALFSRPGASGPADPSLNRNDVDQRTPGTQLDKPERR